MVEKAKERKKEEEGGKEKKKQNKNKNLEKKTPENYGWVNWQKLQSTYFIFQFQTKIRTLCWGVLSTKKPWETMWESCAANMGSNQPLGIWKTPGKKLQNLIYEWTVDFSKFSQIWAKIDSNLRKFWKIGWFCSKFRTKLVWLVYEWVAFSWKIGICTGLLSNSAVAHPYQKPNLTSPPPGPWYRVLLLNTSPGH